MKSSEIQAIITASFIVVLLEHLSKHDRHRESVIRLRNRLITILKKKPRECAVLADNAYDYVKNKYKDENIELDIGIVIEGLAVNKEAYMQEHFGVDIVTMVSRASYKITLPNLTKKQGKDSWSITDEFKKSIEKHTFEYIKEQNDSRD